MNDVLLSTVARALWSKRQVFEVMVDFWSNHLNVTCPSDGVWDNRHLYDRDVIRKHALGSFKDMLVASAKHPSMLVYLNQAESTKDAPNENYGREVLELHTVGVDAGYDENDIYNSAKILTGLTLANLQPPFSDANPEWTRQEYFYDWSIHRPVPRHRHGQDVQHPRRPRRRGGCHHLSAVARAASQDGGTPRPQAVHALRVR